MLSRYTPFPSPVIPPHKADSTAFQRGVENVPSKILLEVYIMAFFNAAVGVLQTLVVALGAGLGIWGAINLLEGYGNDNRATRS